LGGRGIGGEPTKEVSCCFRLAVYTNTYLSQEAKLEGNPRLKATLPIAGLGSFEGGENGVQGPDFGGGDLETEFGHWRFN